MSSTPERIFLRFFAWRFFAFFWEYLLAGADLTPRRRSYVNVESRCSHSWTSVQEPALHVTRLYCAHLSVAWVTSRHTQLFPRPKIALATHESPRSQDAGLILQRTNNRTPALATLTRPLQHVCAVAWLKTAISWARKVDVDHCHHESGDLKPSLPSRILSLIFSLELSCAPTIMDIRYLTTTAFQPTTSFASGFLDIRDQSMDVGLQPLCACLKSRITRSLSSLTSCRTRAHDRQL